MECTTDRKLSQYLCAKYRIEKGNITIRVISDCMAPLIRVNDVVEVTKSDAYLKGNIVAVYINSNIYIHRILSVENGRITTKGDKSFSADPSIDSKMIIGVVTKNVSRKKIIKKSNMISIMVASLSNMESKVFRKMKTDANHTRLNEIYYIRKCMDFLYKICTINC